ncbi:hypothetical protein J1792_13705 [Streptomyces triculaminicus]|uniref:Uncharacterized protein n=1 Tax=Streptomyces triculaminicus TaxID=2816232 RepID=A0A939FKN8_9ACTN|nr:hypothetical protein [Streptomyces triculaminicus]MBO0653795.1 hypothetical protein [Streptomyces triculaminicus]
MQKSNKRVALAACGLLLSAGALTGGATPAAAATAAQGGADVQACYDSAKAYFKPAGSYAYPTGSGVLTTTSNCAGISIRPNTSRYVKVCFLPSSGGSTCQSSYTLATGDEWTVISANVSNGTRFWFHFKSDAQSTGSFAA